MIRIASIALIALPFFLKGVSSQGFIPSITACANSDGDVGYESIADINNDMEREAALILGGKEPETMYEFVLCPNTDLDAGNETLVPLLDNSIFLCGDEGTSPGCAISGGEMQVEIVRPIDGGHTVTSVSFLGIGFSGFTGAAISGNGVSNTTVTISQGTFSNYEAMFGILQQTDDGREPFSVTLLDVSVANAVGGVAFSNVGGVLSAQNLQFSGSNLMGGISTGSSIFGGGINVGMTMVTGVTIASSAIMDLFAAMGGAQLNAAGITVSEMVSMTNLFDIAGPGSVAQIMDVMITDNDFRTTDPPPLWTGVNVRDNAMATATEFVVEDSTNIRYLFGAQGGSMISVDTVDAVNIVGGRQVLPDEISAVFYADESSEAVVSQTTVENTILFTSIAFADGQSNLQYRESCIGMGDVLATVFVGEDSTYTAQNNYINPDFTSTDFCMEQGMRLVKEQEGQTCFDPDNFVSCEVDCEVAFELAACSRDTNVTLAPTSSPVAGEPTAVPTNAPTVGGVPSELPSIAPSEVPTGTPSGTGSVEPTTTVAPSPGNNTTDSPSLVPSTAPSASVAPSASMAPSLAPSVSTGPSSVPSASAAPSASEAPTTSKAPSLAPSVSLAPTTSVAPSSSGSAAPSISMAPTASVASAVPSASMAPSPATTAGEPTGSPTSRPTMPEGAPTGSPTSRPTMPEGAPTGSPTSRPTVQEGVPTASPTSRPTVPEGTPTGSPTSRPTMPEGAPTGSPTSRPTVPEGMPTASPTSRPTMPAGATTDSPTSRPTMPEGAPTGSPTSRPTMPEGMPTGSPTSRPTMPEGVPTGSPTSRPTLPEGAPTGSPVDPSEPTVRPTRPPRPPTKSPTKKPISTAPPTKAPVKKCIKRGKWVKREYKQRGKGYHVYYAFDENLCAEYDYGYYTSSGGTTGGKQTAIFSKGSSGEPERNPEKPKVPQKPKITRKQKKPTRIWIRDESNLRRRDGHYD